MSPVSEEELAVPGSVAGQPGRGRHAAPSKHSAPRAARPLWLEVGALLVIALAVAFLVKTFLAGVYFIPSGSMENTLRVGDRVVVDKLGYRLHDIRRGDVVVFDGRGSFTSSSAPADSATNPVSGGLRQLGRLVGAAPPSEQDFIKRVIGVPGDHVVCCDAQGRVTVNGVPLDEPYLFPGDVPSLVPFDVVVPDGRLWMMGDHRSISADSRAHLGDPGGGMVPASRVIGRARAVIWPFSSVKSLPAPSTFAQVGAGQGTSASVRSLADRAPPRVLGAR